MSERTRDERPVEVAEREADAEAREVDEELEAEREQEAEEDEKAEEAAARAPIGPWLSRSPASRLGLALSVAGVPMIKQLEPYVVEFDWRADGRFELRLNQALSFSVGEQMLAFDERVFGRAAYDGLTELEGAHYADADGAGAVDRITAGGQQGPLGVEVADRSMPVAIELPEDAPALTV